MEMKKVIILVIVIVMIGCANTESSELEEYEHDSISEVETIKEYEEESCTEQEYEQLDYFVYMSEYHLTEDYSFYIIQVGGMYDLELQEKINNSLKQYLYMLRRLSVVGDRYTAFEPIVYLQSSRYLSVGNRFALFLGENRRPALSANMYKTVDMETGELVFIDDLIEINDDFATLVRTGGILRQDDTGDWAITRTDIINQHFYSRENSSILRMFESLSRGNMHRLREVNDIRDLNYLDFRGLSDNFVHLEPGAIVFSEHSTGPIRIYLEDIEEFLKVEKW